MENKMVIYISNEKHDYIFLCENNNCLCQCKIPMTIKQLEDCLYFVDYLICPNCAQKMYRTEEK